MSGPYYNPSVPYTGPIPGGFLPGRMVRVQGRVNPTAQRLTINLQTGPNPYDDIALHFNARFDENVIVRNALISSAWGPEERHGPPLPIFRDQNFEVLILCEASFFKIAVNGQHFAEFNHRVQPLDRINYLSVEGDLTISLIQFDGTSQSGSAYGASAPPGGYAPSGAPYPPASSLPTPGFSLPPGQGMAPPPGGSPYPAAGASPYPPQQQPYGGYPPPGGAPAYYPPQQPGYPAPGQHGYPGAPGGGYPPPGQQGYPPPGQPGYYQPQGNSGHGGGGGLLGDAGKLLAGGLAGVGLGKVASKIPGLGGGGHGHGGHGHGYPGGHGHGGGGGMGGVLPGGILGGAAALAGGALAHKGMKKHKKKGNLMKYGLPVGGAVLGGYALKKGMKGFHGGSSSSSSSSSEEE